MERLITLEELARDSSDDDIESRLNIGKLEKECPDYAKRCSSKKSGSPLKDQNSKPSTSNNFIPSPGGVDDAESSEFDYIPEKVAQRLNEIKALLKEHHIEKEEKTCSDKDSDSSFSSSTDDDLTGLEEHLIRNEKIEVLKKRKMSQKGSGDRAPEDSEDLNFELDIPMTEEVSNMKKMESILKVMEGDKKVADFKLGAFIVACDEFKIGVRLRPAPPTYIKEKTCPQSRMMTTNEEIPKLGELIQRLNEGFNYSQDVIDTLYWLFVVRNDPILETVPMNLYKDIVEEADLTSFRPPDLMLQLTYSPARLKGSFWCEYSRDNTRWAMLPIKGYYLHPLIHEGLKFVAVHDGPGLLLTTTFKTCLRNAALSACWKRSSLASKVKVIVLVEFLRHSSIMCFNEEGEQMGEMGSPKENEANHFIISDPKLAIARYICIYTQSRPFNECLIECPPSLFWGHYKKSIVFLIITAISIFMSTMGVSWGYDLVGYLFQS